MKFTAHIVIERPLEKVFLWMFQPQHIVQLVTWDFVKKTTSDDSSPQPQYSSDPEYDDAEEPERIAKWQRFLEQAETKIEIENLSTLTLHVGTMFDYSMSVRSRSEEFPAFPKFPAWKRMYSGSITIQKSVPPTFFAFAARRSLAGRFSRPKYHHLAFQAQQERTIMTYTQLTGTGMIASMIVSALIPGVAALNDEWVRRQALHLKTQMEAEID